MPFFFSHSMHAPHRGFLTAVEGFGHHVHTLEMSGSRCLGQHSLLNFSSPNKHQWRTYRVAGPGLDTGLREMCKIWCLLSGLTCNFISSYLLNFSLKLIVIIIAIVIFFNLLPFLKNHQHTSCQLFNTKLLLAHQSTQVWPCSLMGRAGLRCIAWVPILIPA